MAQFLSPAKNTISPKRRASKLLRFKSLILSSNLSIVCKTLVTRLSNPGSAGVASSISPFPVRVASRPLIAESVLVAAAFTDSSSPSPAKVFCK